MQVRSADHPSKESYWMINILYETEMSESETIKNLWKINMAKLADFASQIMNRATYSEA